MINSIGLIVLGAMGIGMAQSSRRAEHAPFVFDVCSDVAAAAEAMALGLREGVDAAALCEVSTHSTGNSRMFENRMAHVLAADCTPLPAVDIFVKDLGLVLDMACASKFPLPLSSTAHQMFMQASTAGFAKEDDSAVIKISPGIELPKKA